MNNRNNGSLSNPKILFFILLGILGLLVLNSIGMFWLMMGGRDSNNSTEKPDDGSTKNEVVIDNNNNNDNNNSKKVNRKDYKWEKERFSWGQRTLFPGKANPNRDKGIRAFKQDKYSEAAEFLEKAVTADRNDPEVLIFYNNAKAYDEGNPLTLGVVVPVYNSETSAKEMLRGVAMAQNKINELGGIDGRLLEIVIANDGNEKENSEKVAEELVADSSILGVIGHNSSSATGAGLKVYERKSLAVISPTSTSTGLMSDVFFRTVPSDAIAGETLAEYVKKTKNISKVAIFYNPESGYSTSLKEAFENRFVQDLGGEVIIKEINQDSLDIVREIFRIHKNQAKGIVLFPNTSYTPVAIEIARENADLLEDERLELFGGDSLYKPDTLTNGGESVNNLILAVSWFIESTESQDFKKEGEMQWGGAVSWRTAMSFDATRAYIEALSNSSSDPSRNEVLQELKNVNLPASETSGIPLQFTDEGERNNEPILVQIRLGGVRDTKTSKFGFHLLE